MGEKKDGRGRKTYLGRPRKRTKRIEENDMFEFGLSRLLLTKYTEYLRSVLR